MFSNSLLKSSTQPWALGTANPELLPPGTAWALREGQMKQLGPVFLISECGSALEGASLRDCLEQPQREGTPGSTTGPGSQRLQTQNPF